MAITNQSVLDLARVDLNDDKDPSTGDGARYLEAQLLVYLNDFVTLAYSLRPDLRFGSGWAAPADLLAGADFPLPLRYRQMAAAYIVARGEARDDEHTVNGRFATMLRLGVEGTATT